MTEETIFAEALKRVDRGERKAYLDTFVHDDALRRRVEALLASHEGADEFLRRPALKQLAGSDSNRDMPGTRTSAEESADPRRGMESVLHLLEPARRTDSLGRLNHYEVMEVVGQGGFGTVLKVFDEKLHRVVAIKVLAAELAASGVARQRFLQEARAAAGIRHEHVIDIHAVDDRPVPYLVMEFVDGQTLQEKLNRTGALPIREILRIGLQVAEGLAAAHKQGVIHRDIKPSNILLENGIEKVKISDFGLARREVGDAGLTQSGLIAGTPLYMSPEQAEGKPLDQRSDLFSLGSVLYALGCGRPAFGAESTLAILRRVVDEMPRPLCECNPEVPEWLSVVVAKLLAKKPAERIQSARELADLLSVRLARLQTGEPEQTRTLQMAAPLPGGRVTRRLGLGVAGVCLVLACSFAVGIWQVWPTSDHHADDPAAIAGKPNPLDRLQRDDIPREMLALAGAGDAEIAPAEIVAILGNAEAPRAALNAVAFSPDGQTLAAAGADHTIRVWDLATRSVRILKGHTGEIESVAFSPDGKLLASGSLDTTIMLWDLAGAKEARTLPGRSSRLGGLAFSPDGKTLASGSEDGRIRFWDVGTGQPGEPLFAHADAAVNAVAYSPIGDFLASASADQTVQVCDPRNGRRLYTLKGKGGVSSVAYSKGGKWLAAGSASPDATLRLWDTDTRTERLATAAGPVRCVAFQPGGTLLATGSSNGVLEFWQPTDLAMRSRDIGPGPFGAALLGMAFSPDGRYLAAVGSNGVVVILRVPDPPAEYQPGPVRNLPAPLALAQKQSRADQIRPEAPMSGIQLVATLGRTPFLHKEFGENTPVQSVAYSPDGKFLASASGRFDPGAGALTSWEVKLWDADTGKEIREFPGHLDAIHALAFSPDSQRLVTGSRDGAVKVFEVSTAKKLMELEGQSGPVRAVACSPDGKWIAAGMVEGGGKPGKAILWDAADGTTKHVYDKQRATLSVAFSPDSTMLATVGNHSVYVWQIAAGKEVLALTGYTYIPRSAVFTHDSKRLLTAGEHDVPQVWDLETKRAVLELKGHANWILGVACSKDGARFATSSVDGSVRLWDATSGASIRTFPDHNGFVECVAIRPDGKAVACGDGAGQINVWEVASGKKLFPQPHSGSATALAVSADSEFIASAGKDGSVRLWELPAGKLRHVLAGHDGMVAALAISPDGQTLASGGADRTLRIWDSASGKQLYLLAGHEGAIRQIAFSPAGNTIASASQDGVVKLWNAKTGKPTASFLCNPACACLAFSPDGKTLAVGIGNAVQLRDVATGWSVAALNGHAGAVRSVAFHPDGQTLVSADDDADPTVRLWDLSTLKQKQILPCPAGPVLDCIWRGDGGLLFSRGAKDGTIRCWQPAAPQALPVLPPGTPYAHAYALTSEGRFLAAANADGAIRIFRLAKPGQIFRMPTQN